ncbi:MAG: hypothetical protein ACK56I_00790 [bacterium]
MLRARRGGPRKGGAIARGAGGRGGRTGAGLLRRGGAAAFLRDGVPAVL